MAFSLHHHPLLPSSLPLLRPLPSCHVLLPFLLRASPKPILRLPNASSAAGAAADFPEQVGDKPSGQRKRRKRTVAGIDQDELVDPAELADPDSVFCEISGVKIHHKVAHHEEHDQAQSTNTLGIGLPVILLHGFGASVFSWDRVMKPLARITGSKVLAFDRPAFGLTSRVLEEKDVALNPYSMAFSVMATVSFIEMLGAGKAILLGHSAGCLVAVNTYFEAPEKVAALILVAPAIVAPFGPKKREEGNGDGEERKKEQVANAGNQENILITIWKGLSKFYKFIAGMLLQMLKGMREMVGLVFARTLAAVLRSALGLMLVRMIMDKFGILAIRNAWYDANQVTDHVVQGYTKPLRAKGWEKALLEFTIALLTDNAAKTAPPLQKKLSEITCPVLIVTGDTDRLVPSWNAERLSRVIPGSAFEVIKNCGHLPQEERVEEFLMVVERFLQRVFGAPDMLFSQIAA